MKYDTTPLSINTAGVDLLQPEPEVRFNPVDDKPLESGEISHPTLVGRSVGFDTFIEPPPSISKLEQVKDKLNAPKYRSWALTALLASVSAFGGGFAVYWVSHERAAVVTDQPKHSVVEPETEIKASDTFVPRSAVDSAAAEPLIPQSPNAPAVRGRTHSPAVTANTFAPSTEIIEITSELSTPDGTQTQPLANSAAPPTTQEPQREAKVGAYVVEKPAGRKPLAQCADGTYSYSASKSAACAGRGGVGEWIGNDKPVPTTPTKQAAYVLGPRGGCYYLDSTNKKIYVEKKYCEQ